MKTKLLLAASLLFGMGAVKAQFSPFNRVINVKLDTVATYNYDGTGSGTTFKESPSATQFFSYPVGTYVARALFSQTANTQMTLGNSGVLTMKNPTVGVIKSSFYNIQNASAIVKFAFDLDLTNYTGLAPFVVSFGNAAAPSRLISASTSNTAATDIFGTFRIVKSGNLITQYKNASDANTAPATHLIKAGISQRIEIFVNSNSTATSYTYNSTPVNLPGNSYHIYVAGTKHAEDFPKDGTSYVQTTVNGLTFEFSNNATQETVSISNLSITYPSATDPTLPVSLASFIGKKAANGIILNWATVSEQHNDYFEVTRSTDGKTFTPIGTVKGKGTTNQSSRYSLTDNAPVSGTNYYQLKQYDEDGSQTTYQETVAVDYALNQEHFAVNAAQNKLNVSVYSSVASWGELTVFDLKGAKLMQAKVQLKAGQNVFAVDAGKLTSGLLIARLTGANLNKVAKFIK